MNKQKRKAISALRKLIKTIEKDTTVVNSMTAYYAPCGYSTPKTPQAVTVKLRYRVPIKTKRVKAKK